MIEDSGLRSGYVGWMCAVVVVGILALVGLLGYPSYRQHHASDLNDARSVRLAIMDGTPLSFPDAVSFDGGKCQVMKVVNHMNHTFEFPGEMAWGVTNRFYVGSVYRFYDGPPGQIRVHFIDRGPGDAIALIHMDPNCAVADNMCVRKNAYDSSEYNLGAYAFK